MTKYKYKVFVDLQAGPDDSMSFEYTGVEYSSKQEAQKELRKARKEIGSHMILDAYIVREEVENEEGN